MEIKSGFYLTGFTRIDKGEQGAVFVRYDELNERRAAPAINEGYLNYGGKNSENFVVSIPSRNIIAAAIVTRTSKNRYSATAFGVRLISTIYDESLDGLRGKVAQFFEEDSKNNTQKRSSDGF